MYREAEKEIRKGLSLGARVTLGFFATFFGAVMFLAAPADNKAVFAYMVGIFCFLVAIACFTKGRTRQFIGSIIGAILFLLSLSYFGYEALSGKVISSGRSEPSLLNAVSFIILFGIPGIAYVIAARFGFKKNAP